MEQKIPKSLAELLLYSDTPQAIFCPIKQLVEQAGWEHSHHQSYEKLRGDQPRDKHEFGFM